MIISMFQLWINVVRDYRQTKGGRLIESNVLKNVRFQVKEIIAKKRKYSIEEV